MSSEPFAYPTSSHVRRHGPSGWPYKRYRSWLRDEFTFRCVFCLRRERWLGTRRSTFEIDHCNPQSQRPDLRNDYDNLLYTCASCNRLKLHYKVADPCQRALGSCVQVEDDGSITWLNEEGHRLVRILGLDDPSLKQFRADLMADIKGSEEAYVRWMRYPDELPNLALPPIPPHNSRPDGVSQSCYAKRQRGELPEVY